jgi:hypothetical protein
MEKIVLEGNNARTTLHKCTTECTMILREVSDQMGIIARHNQTLDDAGASLHVSQPASQPRQRVHSKLKRGATLIFNFEFECNLMFRLLSHEAVLCTGIRVGRPLMFEG